MENIFAEMFSVCDIIISSFTNLMVLPYGNLKEFLQGDYIYQFSTYVTNIQMSFSIPNWGVTGVLDFIIDSAVGLLSYLFTPLPILQAETLASTPFYMCFFSFIIVNLIGVGLFKLISFLIK